MSLVIQTSQNDLGFSLYPMLSVYYVVVTLEYGCYELKLKSKSERITLYRVYIRELNRVSSTKCLFYIHLANGIYYTKPSLLWGICVLYTIDI